MFALVVHGLSAAFYLTLTLGFGWRLVVGLASWVEPQQMQRNVFNAQLRIDRRRMR